MTCRKINVDEYKQFLPQIQDGTIKKYSKESDCLDKCCQNGGCCAMSVSIQRGTPEGDCGYLKPCFPPPGDGWINVGATPHYCNYQKCVPGKNGRCNPADFTPPLTTCTQYEQICEPQGCYPDCVKYGEVCPDPNDPNSCYTDCLEFGEICPPDYCYQNCVDFTGVDLPPCTWGDNQYPRNYDWNVFWGGNGYNCSAGCCNNGECPPMGGVFGCNQGACCGTYESGQPFCVDFSTAEQCANGFGGERPPGTFHFGKFCSPCRPDGPPECCPT